MHSQHLTRASTCGADLRGDHLAQAHRVGLAIEAQENPVIPPTRSVHANLQ